MKNIYYFLNEAATSVLYHFTNSTKIENLLKTNTFYLTSNLGSKSDNLDSKDYYMSFTRTKSNKKGYGAGFRNPGSVRINLDGSKLNQRYKFVSVDYWQMSRDVKSMVNSNTDEMEERLVSNKDEVKNANKYIKSIDIYEKDGIVSESIIEDCKNLNIKLNVFDNAKDFSAGRSERAVEPKSKETVIDDYDSTNEWEFVTLIGAFSYKKENKDEIINSASKMVKTISSDSFINQINDYHKKLDYNLRPNNKYGLSDMSNSLSSDLQTSRKSASKMLRYAVKELTTDFRKTNSKDVTDYLNNKIYIGKKKQSDFNKELNDKAIKLIDEKSKDIIENLGDNTIYDIDGESEYIGLMGFPRYKKFYDKKVKEIKEYISDYLMNNDDMFKYSYKISDSEIIDALDIDDTNEEVISISDQLENQFENNLVRPLYELLWGIVKELEDEIYNAKEESKTQWKK